MKRIARPDETIVAVPVIVEPVEVQVPLILVPVEIRDIAVTVRVLPDYTKHHPHHCPLNTLRAVSYSGSLNPPMLCTE